MNRAESVRGLVTRCRESADAVSGEAPIAKPASEVRMTAAIDLRQAANEIEDLAGIVDNEESAFYGRLRRAMQKALYEFVTTETGYASISPLGGEEPYVLLIPDDGAAISMKVSTHPLTVSAKFDFERRHPA